MNTVLLVVPLVAFVIVVLLGFTGCSLNTRGKPGPPPEPPPVPQDYDDEVKQYNQIA
jgi:hypothetical protein